jgi:hypothetical protein
MRIYQILAILGSLALIVFIIDFIRRGLLKEKYSVLWLISSFAILVLSVRKSLLDTLAGYLGVAYAPSLLFLVAFLFVLLIMLHFSVVISILHDKNKSITQELTLLKEAFKDAKLLKPGNDDDER